MRLRFNDFSRKGLNINYNQTLGIVTDKSELKFLKQNVNLKEINLRNFKLVKLPPDEDIFGLGELYFYKDNRELGTDPWLFNSVFCPGIPNKIFWDKSGLVVVENSETYIIAPIDFHGEFKKHSCMNSKVCENPVFENEDIWIFDFDSKNKFPFCSYLCLKSWNEKYPDNFLFTRGD